MISVKGSKRVGVHLSIPTIGLMVPLMATTAFGQAASEITAAPRTDALAGGALAEIVVTAQKRKQGINEVPMSITALNATSLAKLHVSSLADLVNNVSGMSFTTTKTGNPVYTLRGIGFYDPSLSSYPAVSVYVDQIPLAFPALTAHVQYDVDRVEVMKGPQGTLFGENSTGGAVNVVVAKPTREFAAGVDVGYGNFNATNVEAFVSGPIAHGLTARLAGRVEYADGWQKSLTRPGDTNGKTANAMLRFLADYKPSAAVRFEFMLSAWREKGETQAPQLVGFQPQFGKEWLSQAELNAPYARLDPESADWLSGLPGKSNTFSQVALRGEFDLTSDVTLTSLTSFVRYQQIQGEAVGGIAAPVFDDTRDDGIIKSFTQELRVANSSKDAFRWMFGGNFEHSIVDQDIHLGFAESSTDNILGTVFGFPIITDHTTSDQTMRNYALFTSDEYDLTSALTLRAGARYTHAHRTASICNADDVAPYYTGQFFFDIEAGGRYGPYTPNACFAINNVESGLINAPALGAPGRFQDDLTEHNVSWTVGPQWKPNQSTLLYLSASKGYKQGGFPTLSASTFSQYLPVQQESVLAYETGVKSTLAEGRVQITGAVYYYDYANKQLASKVVDPVFGVLDVLQNIPKSSIRGVELGVLARPIAPLTLNVQGSYMNGKIDKYIGINNAGVPGDFAGTPLPATPKWQFAGDAEYDFTAFGAYQAFIGLNATYRSATVSIVGGKTTPADFYGEVSSPYTVDSYALLNVRTGFSSPDRRWRFMIWGKNILNKYYWFDTIQTTSDPITRYAGMPATYGIDVSYTFL